MKTTLYLRQIDPFIRFVWPITLLILAGIASIPARIVEIFMRRNFGERYFSWEIPMLIFVLLIAPYIVQIYIGYPGSSPFTFLHALLCLAIPYATYKRHKEVKRSTDTFDDTVYSYYSGDQLKMWDKVRAKYPKLKADYVRVERYYEGAVFILIGFVALLIPFTMVIGVTMMVAGISYIIKVYYRYQMGRSYILDMIDKKIINEQMYDTFVNENPPDKTQGFQWSGPKPGSRDVREKIYEQMLEEEDDKASVVS